MTLRLRPEVHRELTALAAVEEKSVTEVVEEAVVAHIERRMADAVFQAKLKMWIQELQALVKS